jgi:hypothetical protein
VPSAEEFLAINLVLRLDKCSLIPQKQLDVIEERLDADFCVSDHSELVAFSRTYLRGNVVKRAILFLKRPFLWLDLNDLPFALSNNEEVRCVPSLPPVAAVVDAAGLGLKELDVEMVEFQKAKEISLKERFEPDHCVQPEARKFTDVLLDAASVGRFSETHYGLPSSRKTPGATIILVRQLKKVSTRGR